MLFEKTITSEAELPAIVAELLIILHNRPIKIALLGNLGAGKTTFSKALCAQLGIRETATSPTFSLINEYTFVKKTGETGHVYHIDLYRLKNIEEAFDIGLLDILYSEAVCLVEWPQVIEEHLPEDFVFLYIHALDAGTRRFELYETAQNSAFLFE